MRLHLGGHLAWYDAQRRAWIEMRLAAPMALAELLGQLEVPIDEVAITTVNGRAMEAHEAIIADGDRVEVYPAIGGGNR
jgi:sulfur carrier protein ThiS